ncbi:hypothetical protein GTX07_04000 [Streptomyces sp. SID5606]|nr:hypothetical protein [Streptomyces sp. SID5606]
MSSSARSRILVAAVLCLEVFQVTRLWRAFPEKNQEAAEDLRSYESTRCPPWPANSFMVSATDPGGAQGGVLRPIHVNST